MRANEESREGAEQLFHAPVHRIDRFSRDESSTDAALIAHDGQGQSRLAQAIEQCARVGRRLDALGIAVERDVDHDRLIAIEKHRTRFHWLGRRRDVDFGAGFDELAGFFGDALLSVFANVLGDLHRAEMRAAHGAEMRGLGAVLRQRFVVEFARGYRGRGRG